MSTDATTTVTPEAPQTAENAPQTAENASENGTSPRRGRKSRPVHPAFLDEKGNRTVKVDAIPEDYSREAFATLQEDDFSEPAVYWDWMAAYYDGKAASARQQANLCRSFDNEEQRKNAQKFARLSSQLEQLAETLGKGDNPVDLDMIRQLMG